MIEEKSSPMMAEKHVADTGANPKLKSKLTISALNQLGETDFLTFIGDVYEHAPWAAARAWAMRPFASVEALHHALYNGVRGQTPVERLAFFNRYARLNFPELREQLDAYHSRYGFPFILCTVGLSPTDIRRVLERRLRRDLASERDAAMDEISLIARHRLVECLSLHSK